MTSLRVYLVDKCLKLFHLSLLLIVLTALLQEETQRSHLIATKFNRFRKNKEKRKQSKRRKEHSAGVNPAPRSLVSALPPAHARDRGRGPGLAEPLAIQRRGTDAPSAPARPSPCPVGTSDSNCTAPSREGRNKGKRRVLPSSRNRGTGMGTGMGMLPPAPLCFAPSSSCAAPKRCHQSLCPACHPLETPPTPESLLPNSHRQTHQ